jgi:hypothetical protein
VVLGVVAVMKYIGDVEMIFVRSDATDARGGR